MYPDNHTHHQDVHTDLTPGWDSVQEMESVNRVRGDLRYGEHDPISNGLLEEVECDRLFDMQVTFLSLLFTD